MRIERNNQLSVVTETEKFTTEAPTTNAIHSNTTDVFESHASTSRIAELYDDPSLSELIKEKRDEYKSAFQKADEKQQENMEKLADLVKTLNQIRTGNIKI